MSEYRFEVALSFPGEYRARVEVIAETLAAKLDRDKVLYYPWFSGEFARPRLDLYLQELYHKQSRLVVFFFCRDYAEKEWCGLEWDVGRDLLKQRKDDQLMFLRFDDAKIPGLYSIHGYMDIAQMSDLDVASDILTRLGKNVDKVVEALRAQTRTDIQTRCGTIKILTMEQPIGLGGIYTDVHFLEKRTANLRKPLKEFRFDEAYASTDRVAGIQVFNEHPRLMIYGKPGAGKTTFLKRLAIECASGKYRADLVPVFVTLLDYAGTQLSLFEYVEHQWGTHPETKWLLEAGRGLVLLDGLDEVRDSDFVRVRKAIEAFVGQFPLCPTALTCRIAAREYVFAHFTEVEMADFDEPQIVAYANRWFGEKAAVFLEKLRANEAAYRLASSPLLLTLICLVFGARGDFGDSRAGLYDEGLDVLLKKWDSTRGIDRELAYGLTVTIVEALLTDIAYNRFVKSEYFFDRDSLAQQIGEFFQERSLLPAGQDLDVEKVLNSVESHIGLLVQRAAKVYSFSHLTFQEYLTAKRIEKRRTLLAQVGPNVGDRRWREVWLLVVTLGDGDEIIPILKRHTDALVRNDSQIQRYLGWCRRKAEVRPGRYKPSALRAFYFALAFDLTLASHLTLAIDLDMHLRDARDRVGGRVRIRGRDLDLEIELIVALARANALDRLELVPASAREFWWRGMDLDRSLARAVKTAAKVAANDFAVALKDLAAERPGPKSGQDWWGAHGGEWREKLRAVAIGHRDIGHEWNFTREQRDLLDSYYVANLLLVNCMNEAKTLTNKTRQYIEDTMLLPWDEIYPPQP